jgi:acetyl esterase/lipase
VSEAILDLPAPPADRRIPYGTHPAQFSDLRLPPGDGPFPVAIGLHGGYWRNRYGLSYLGHVCTTLTRHGIATWNVEYRRLGDAGGGWPGTLVDVAAAADALRSLAPAHRLDLTRVVAIGHSAGGQLACWLAARQRLNRTRPLYRANPLPLRGAIALAGVLDLRRAFELRLSANATELLLGGTPGMVPARYAAASPYDLLPTAVPQVLLHGTADDSVPYELSARYAARARELGDDVELITLPGAGHFEPVDPTSAAWPLVERAALRLLATRQ